MGSGTTKDPRHESPSVPVGRHGRPTREVRGVDTLRAMLLLLSPAKTLDYDSPLPDAVVAARAALKPVATAPQYADRAADLISALRTRSIADIAAQFGEVKLEEELKMKNEFELMKNRVIN